MDPPLTSSFSSSSDQTPSTVFRVNCLGSLMNSQETVRSSSDQSSVMKATFIRQQTQEAALQHKPFEGSEAPILAPATMGEPLNRLVTTPHGVTKDAVPTLLAEQEASAILSRLIAQCHSLDVLRARSYKLPGEPTSKGKQHPCPKFRASLPDEVFKATPLPRISRKPTAPGKRAPGAPQLRVREAIVLDCEMVTCGDHAEVAYLSAIDFLSGEVLIDSHVQPAGKVTRWHTRFSGVSVESMRKAHRQGKIIYGWRQARERLWKFASSQTVLVGHSLQNDLNVLGIWHPRIVDSAILTSLAIFPESLNARTWSLKSLAQEFIEIDIQTGSGGHDALEDTRATREVVLYCLRDPERLRIWAVKARVQEEARMEAVRIKAAQAKAEQARIEQEREQQPSGLTS